MNSLDCTIAGVRECGRFRQVSLKSGNNTLDCLTLELPSEYGEGREVFALFKETETVLAPDGCENSLENRLDCRVVEIRRGELVSHVLLETACGNLSSVVTTASVDRLRLVAGGRVNAWFAASSVSLTEREDV